MNGTRFGFDFFSVYVDYGANGPAMKNGEPKRLVVTIESRYKVQANLSVHWYLPEGEWSVSPSADGYSMCLPPLLARLTKPLAFEFTFTAARLTRATHRDARAVDVR